MTKKEMEFAKAIAEAVVSAMKGTKAEPTSGKKVAAPKVKKGRGTATETTKYSMKLADYEPKKVDGHYVWGKKTDTIKSKHYMAMQKAYCYAVATKGKAINSDECYKQGIEVDFSEDGAYYKAKADFNKKFTYVKKSDR